MDELKHVLKDYRRGIISASEVFQYVLEATSVNNPFIRALFGHIETIEIMEPDKMVEKLEEALKP
jgi:hypothetical protein